MSVVSVVCCQVEVFASGCSLAQKSRTECGVCECGREASTVRRPWSTRVCFAMGVMYNKSTEWNKVCEIIFKNSVIVSRTTHGTIIAKLVS